MATSSSTAASTAAREAASAWEKAPMHVKAMAGPYVKPMIAAVLALAQAIEEIGGQQSEQGNGKT